jgi:predicted ATP-dependent endonuclease of OLD family
MKITAVELKNIRGFKYLPKTDFSERINVLIGSNNSGKSTILNSIFSLQRPNALVGSDVTIGEIDGEVKLFLKGILPSIGDLTTDTYYLFNPANQERKYYHPNNKQVYSFNIIPEQEPENLIYPFLSKRKSVDFNNQINEQNTNSVYGNFTYLFSKIDRLITPQYQPGNSQYIKACKQILGFEISTLVKDSGKRGVYYIHNQEHIPLTAMGEGVTNIIGLITDLCVAENKIFIIEEPENDIHPKALKSLLNFIIEKSDTNQFFVSTHSNIVMKHLGGLPDSRIFSLSSELSDRRRPNLFISNLREIPQNSYDRMRVMESLGYEFSDLGIWDAWLFLEESSAEVLIREFIKWYIPELNNRLRTFSARSLSEVIPKFDDFNKLFVFLHLEPTYKNKVWVIIDEGEEEAKIIQKLKDIYSKNGWKKENFTQFSEHDFEKYYPERFQSKVNSILSETSNDKKREAKKNLLDEVKKWIFQEESIAKEEFKVSAQEVIIKLKEIAKEINN